MSAFWQALAGNPAVETLGWALLHFVWQGTLLAFVLRCLLAVLRNQPANLRYWTATATLFLMPLVAAATLSKPRTPANSLSPAAAVAAPTVASPRASDSGPTDVDEPSSPLPGPSQRNPRRSETFDAGGWLRDVRARLPGSLPCWMSAFWILGAVIVSIRTFGGLVQARHVCRDARDIVPPRELSDLIRRSGIGAPIRVLESRRVCVPTVIGWRNPVVLFPAGSALETGHAQALLAHELAHVGRRDYLVNLLQAAVEIVLFYHPAVWWTSARVRIERECCCDDAAVAMCGDVRTYVRALSDAERQLSASKLALALGGTPLLDRIRRLTEMKALEHRPAAVWATGMSVVAFLLACSMASTLFAFIPAGDAVAVTPAAPVIVSSPASASGAPPAFAMPSVPASPARPAPAVRAPDIARPEVQQPAPFTITGTVFDPTGDAVVPGASISIVDADTKQVLVSTMSKVNGAFEVSSPKANYYIQISLAGFETQVLESSQVGSRPLRIQMELGPIQEVATVTSESAAPAVAPNARIRVGGNIAPPKLVTRTEPIYPADARDAGVEGSVVVSALIDRDGSVKNPVALSGHRLLRDAAVECVSQWAFRPAKVNGDPWPMRLSTTVVFKLQR